MKINKKIAAFIAIACSSLSAFAHSGHGAGETHQTLHYLTEWIHFVPIALGLMLLMTMVWARKQSRRMKAQK